MFTCVCMCVIHPCVLGPEPQGRAAYPPVAPKPELRMATGGAGPGYADGGAQGSPVVMKRAVTVQSSRPQTAVSATMAQQGRGQSGHNHWGGSLS